MSTNFSVMPGMNAGQLAGAYNQWAAYNGGDTLQNRQIANDMLGSMGYTQDQINAGYQSYLGNHTVNGVAPTYQEPAAQIPGHLGGPLIGPQGYNSGLNASQQYNMAQLGGFRGTLQDWVNQQSAYKQQAIREIAAAPDVVVGGYTPQTQLEAVKNYQPPTLPPPPPPPATPTQPPSPAPAPGPAVGGNQGQSANGGASGGLFQGVNVNTYQPNPYLSQMGDVLTGRVTNNLNRNIMPGIRANAVAAGGFGGSRQGVVEANAMKDANQTISDALTGAYFQDFTNQMNRNLQQYGQNQGFYSNQRGQDLQQTQLGANLFNMGNQGFLSQGQGIYGLGSQQQQAPWQVVNNANAGLGQWSGYGTTTSANQGGGAQGALGGALAGGQLGNLWGGSSNAAGGINSSGFGTGIGFGNQDFGQFF